MPISSNFRDLYSQLSFTSSQVNLNILRKWFIHFSIDDLFNSRLLAGLAESGSHLGSFFTFPSSHHIKKRKAPKYYWGIYLLSVFRWTHFWLLLASFNVESVLAKTNRSFDRQCRQKACKFDYMGMRLSEPSTIVKGRFKIELLMVGSRGRKGEHCFAEKQRDKNMIQEICWYENCRQ